MSEREIDTRRDVLAPIEQRFAMIALLAALSWVAVIGAVGFLR